MQYAKFPRVVEAIFPRGQPVAIRIQNIQRYHHHEQRRTAVPVRLYRQTQTDQLYLQPILAIDHPGHLQVLDARYRQQEQSCDYTTIPREC